MKRIISMLLITALLLTLAACGGSAADTKAAHVLDNQDPLVPMDQLSPVKNSQKLGYQLEEPAKGEEIAVMTMKTGEVIKIRFFPDEAPKAVYNFKLHAIQGYYDGLTFHRVIPGFMIQGGCPDGTGMGGPGYSIRGEFLGNGFEKNDLKHTLGVLSMARSMSPDSAGSQFFIMVDAAPHLDGQYAAFGKITKNAEAAVAVSRVPRSMMDDKPKKPQVISSIRVDTQQVEYPEPEKK